MADLFLLKNSYCSRFGFGFGLGLGGGGEVGMGRAEGALYSLFSIQRTITLLAPGRSVPVGTKHKRDFEAIGKCIPHSVYII